MLQGPSPGTVRPSGVRGSRAWPLYASVTEHTHQVILSARTAVGNFHELPEDVLPEEPSATRIPSSAAFDCLKIEVDGSKTAALHYC